MLKASLTPLPRNSTKPRITIPWGIREINSQGNNYKLQLAITENGILGFTRISRLDEVESSNHG